MKGKSEGSADKSASRSRWITPASYVGVGAWSAGFLANWRYMEWSLWVVAPLVFLSFFVISVGWTKERDAARNARVKVAQANLDVMRSELQKSMVELELGMAKRKIRFLETGSWEDSK